MKKISLVVVLLASLLTVTACNSSDTVKDASAKTEYISVAAKQSNIDSAISISGTVKSNETIDVDAPFDMIFDSLNVEVGNYVEEGQVIAHLSAEDIADMTDSMQDAYEAAINALNAATDASKATETVTLKSPVDGHVTNIKVKEGDQIADVMKKYGYLAQIIDSKGEVIYNVVGAEGIVDFVNDLSGKKVSIGDTILQASKTAADFQDKIEKVNDITEKMATLRDCEGIGMDIYSPITGVISKINLTAEMDEIKMDETLMEIVKPNDFYVSASVSESNYSKITEGTVVYVTIDALNKTYEGTVSYVSNSGVSGSFPIKIDVLNAYDLKLGMSATLKVITNTYEDKLVIPIDAVYTATDGQRYILLESDAPNNPLTDVDSRAQIVTVGKTDGYNIEIVDGLSLGQIVLEPKMATYVANNNTSNSSDSNLLK